jgi:hypothetical protein
MPAIEVRPSFPTFFDRDGSPLENGYLFIGVENQNPEVKGNRQAVFWDEALTVPAAQPVRTIGGYPSRFGSPAQIFTDGDYALTVRDRNMVLIYTASSNVLSAIEANAAAIAIAESDIDALETTVSALPTFTAIGEELAEATDAADARDILGVDVPPRKSKALISSALSQVIDGNDTFASPLLEAVKSNVTLQAGSWFIGVDVSFFYAGTVSDPGSTRAIASVELRLAGTSTVVSGVFAAGVSLVHYPLGDDHFVQAVANDIYTFASDTVVDVFIRAYTINADAGDDFQITVSDAILHPVDVI